jgi:regulator of replication initiation timing
MRVAEYVHYVTSSYNIFTKYDTLREDVGCLLDDMGGLLEVVDNAMIAERRSEKVREKNDADRFRDRMHSRVFNYLRFILSDERDPRFDDAHEVMKVMQEAGNPTQLAENVQSVMMVALGNRLLALTPQLVAIDAKELVYEMIDANNQFIAIEKELREMLAAQKLDPTPMSVTAARRLIDPVFRDIFNAINAFVKIPTKHNAYIELVAEMNVLTARVAASMAASRRTRTGNDPNE